MPVVFVVVVDDFFFIEPEFASVIDVDCGFYFNVMLGYFRNGS